MRSKLCKECSNTKPVAEFHRTGVNSAGNTEYRGKCRVCVNARLRVTYAHTKVNKRRSTEYIDMPVEARRKTYEDAINRMHRFGIISDTTAEESLRRVKGE